LEIKFRKALKFAVCAFMLLAFASNTIYCQVQAQTELSIKHFTINAYNIFDTTPQIYAGLYDMSVADWSTNVRAGIAQVKTIKPDFKALLYCNTRTADPLYTGRVELFAQNGWLLKDRYENYIRDDVGWLVDVGNPAYQSYIANYLNTQINNLGYDGVYADNSLFWGASELFWGISVTPINPRTNQPWTDTEARGALVGLHKAIKSAIGSKLLCCNGIWSGYRFYDHQSEYQEILLASPMDGFMSEGIWHPYVHSTTNIWMSEQQWRESVQFLIWIQNHFLSGHPNKFYMPVCKLAFGNQVYTNRPSGATREQMATYAFASTLLGAKVATANQIYLGVNSESDFCKQVMQPLYNAQIGTPTTDIFVVSGTHVYARDFSNGKVLVNPTDSSYTVNLGSPNFVNAATGQSVPQTITIPPHTGRVLTGATEPSPNPSPTPSTEIWTDKAAYDNGETMYVYVQATNPGPAINIRLTAKIGLPGGGTYGLWTIYQGYVPAGYYGRAILWETFQVPHSTAAGTYSWICEMRDAATNAQIDSDTYYWTAT